MKCLTGTGAYKNRRFIMSNRKFFKVKRTMSGKGHWIAIMMVVLICTVSGSFALSKEQYGNNGSSKIVPITDGELLGWVGKWQGHCHVGPDSLPIEIRWKLSDDRQWLRGEFKIWSDFQKKSIIHSEIIFIRPDNAAGIYKGVALAEDGNCRIGRAEIKDRVWEWSWTYDNGSQEHGKLVLYAQGEITYDARVVDAQGREIKTLDYDITRPYLAEQK